MKKTTATMKDVAREAGVAIGTVAKVFNGGTVGESYRSRVLLAAQKLGFEATHYQKTQKKETAVPAPVIAAILPDLKHPFFCALVRYLYEAVEKRGGRLQLFLTGSDLEKERICIETACKDKLSGITGVLYNGTAAENLPIPVVTVDRIGGSNVPCVSSDNYGGGCMAAEKLIELGCRHLAFLRTGVLAYGEVDKRGAGFEAACRTNQVPCEVCWLNTDDDFEIFREFFQKNTVNGKLQIDGIGCSTDRLAWQIEKLLTEMGYRVPEDVQIIGYDGLRKFLTDELYCSTIVQPIDRMADACVDILLRNNHLEIPSLVCLPVSYAAGGTTKD